MSVSGTTEGAGDTQPNAAITAQRVHIDSLDGLRGLAAFIVFVSHFSNDTGIFGKLVGAGAGQLGVMLFFALSSFLMCYLYYEFEHSPATQLKRFALSRAIRILPLIYLAILLSYLLRTYQVIPAFSIRAQDIIPNMLFLKGNGVLWTIGPEIAFYTLFAAIFFVPKRFHLYIMFAVAAYVLFFSEIVRFKPTGYNIPDRWYVYEYFAIGPLVYFLWQRNIRFPASLDKIVAVLCPLVFFIHYPQVLRALFGAGLPQNGWHSLQCFFVIAFTLYATLTNPYLHKVLSVRPLRYLGELSFSLYVMHMFVIQYFQKHGLLQPTLASLALATAATLAVSTALFELYEKPIRRYLRRRLR